MATVSFLYRSKKDFAPLTVRLQNGKPQYHARTKILVEKDYYSIGFKKCRNLTNEEQQRKDDLEQKLNELKKFILVEFYKTEGDISNHWLKETVSRYYNSSISNPDRLTVAYWIQKCINAHSKKNTIENYKNLDNLLELYEQEELDRKLKVSDLTQGTFDSLSNFMKEWVYRCSTSYVYLSALKTVGRKIDSDIKLPDGFDRIKIHKCKDDVDDDIDVIYLTDNEIERISKLNLKKPHLINARKWFWLGVNTGQRQGDLMNKVIPNINIEKGVLKFTQQKTGNKVSIPILKPIQEMVNKGELPRPISLKYLNEYFKKLGELAQINEPINDYLKEKVKEKKLKDGRVKKLYRLVKKERPKYMYLSSHTFRRTFCMRYYNSEMEIRDIMAMSGHKTEAMFLRYINKSNDQHLERAREIMEHYG